MAKAVEIKAKRILGIEDEPNETDRDETPRRVFADWLDDHLVAIGRNLRLSDSTKANARTCANIVKSYLVHKRRPRLLMSKIDKKWILGLFDYMKNVYRNTKSPDSPKPLSPRTLHLHERTLRRFFDEAVMQGLMAGNPIRALSAHELMPKIPAEKPYLTRDEVTAMANETWPNETARRAFLFCSFTGLRYSDVKALRWCHIKRTSIGQQLVLPAMRKTGKPLIVPLNEMALSYLPEMPKSAHGEVIFTGLVSLGQCDRILKKVASAAGVTKNVSFHIARHTFASLSIAAGGDVLTVSKLLGHRRLESTQVYATVSDTAKISAISRITDYFSK